MTGFVKRKALFKSGANIFALVAVLFSFLIISIPTSQVFADDVQYKSTYDRVMKTKTLRCGYFNWAPHFTTDPLTGAHSGFVFDMVEQLGKVLNITIEWTSEYSLGTQIEALKTGKIDALCADGTWTRSALPYLDYTDGYMGIAGYAYVLKSNKKITDFQSLNSPEVTFTNIDGDGSAEYLQMYFPKAKVLSMPSTTDAVMLGKNVITGKADAVLNDPMSIEAYPLGERKQLRLVGEDHPLAISPIFISLPKGQQDLLNMLNQGIGLMNDVGLIDQVLNKYDPSGKKLLRPQKRFK